MLDRIDIHIEVSCVDAEKWSGDRLCESSETIRKRIQATRDVQSKRFVDVPDIICNANMHVGEIRRLCRWQDEGQSLMRAAIGQLHLSARAYHCTLRLAHPLADLCQLTQIR